MRDNRSSGGVSGKSPLIAALLAVLYPGLGHVYLRRWGRALLWFVLIVASVVVLVPETAVPATLSMDAIVEARQAVPQHVALVALVLSGMSVIDAYWIAAQTRENDNTDSDEGGTQTCPSCGKELDEDLDFCHWCTTRLDEYGKD